MNEQIRKYAELTAHIKQMEQHLKEEIEQYKLVNDYNDVKDQVLEAMLADRQKTIPTGYGNVTVRETRTYEYPDSFTQEQDEFKISKQNIEKELLRDGKYSVNAVLMLAGKPKQTEEPKLTPNTIH